MPSSPASSSTLRPRCLLRRHVRCQRDRALAGVLLDPAAASQPVAPSPRSRSSPATVPSSTRWTVDGAGPELARRFYLE
ncbi:hypothetical protein [Sorangium sp. So ce388]|uniref:hypothetical protein n=1 Tax=Sorangium sp. So ce388 TaxID=3133309 RepID=UPI003F5BBD7D